MLPYYLRSTHTTSFPIRRLHQRRTGVDDDTLSTMTESFATNFTTGANTRTSQYSYSATTGAHSNLHSSVGRQAEQHARARQGGGTGGGASLYHPDPNVYGTGYGGDNAAGSGGSYHMPDLQHHISDMQQQLL